MKVKIAYINPEQLETLENMISYYQFHTVEKISKSRPGFITEDLEKLLTVVNEIINN